MSSYRDDSGLSIRPVTIQELRTLADCISESLKHPRPEPFVLGGKTREELLKELSL